jgi:Tol biopolymer transport system component
MPLIPGTRLGPYEIVAPLGAGGMGEVYRARDGTLNRDVAVKVLLASVADDPDRLARFRREAQVLASLNHPNIAHIHGLEDLPVDGGSRVRALVMELVEGDDLTVLIARGPIPLEDALPIARQIADALEAAHEQGIIHRDLKPANIKVRPDGTVKVLDFGLAKAMDPAGASSANAMNSPTLSIHATQAGIILGTAAYMSPEQARGKAVDRRADIWAFGAVLFEMLAGTRAFKGDDVTDTIVSVVSKEPDWTALPANVSAEVGRLLVRCLKKDPKTRMRDIGEARLAIDDGTRSTDTLPAPVIPRGKRRERVAWMALVAAASAATGAAGWLLQPVPAAQQSVTRFAYPLPEGQAFSRPGRHSVALSPDGTKLAYIANQQIYLRPLDRLNAQPLRGTDEDPLDLVFSPDGQWIAYFAPATKGSQIGISLKKIAVSGGAAVKLCATAAPSGVSWRDNTIVFGQNIPGRTLIQAVADTGGVARTLVSLDQGLISHPQLLDDGKHVLYSVRRSPAATWENGEIVVQALDGGAPKVVVRGAADGRLLPTGHLLYVHEGALFAIAFDRTRLETSGGPVPVVEGVRTALVGVGSSPGAGQFTLSTSGTLAYVPGVDRLAALRTLVWADRQGTEQPIEAPARLYNHPRLSPDGTKIAVDIRDQEKDIWTWDLERRQLMRLTFGPAEDYSPVWAPDGRSIVYIEGAEAAAALGGAFDIFRKAANNTGTAERLTSSATAKFASALSPDGRFLVYRQDNSGGLRNLFVLTLGAIRPPQPLFQSQFSVLNAEISPDGRWIAYQSNESSQDEVYVRPFPAAEAGRWQVSVDGGTVPMWSRSGRELFFARPGDGKLYAVAVAAAPGGGAFSFGGPQALFALAPYFSQLGRTLDVSLDGQRFLAVKSPEMNKGQDSVVVVSRWFEELKARVPIK